MRGGQVATEYAKDYLRALQIALGVAVDWVAALPQQQQRAIRQRLHSATGVVDEVRVNGARFIACRCHRQADAIVVAGPYRLPDDIVHGELPVLTDAQAMRVRAVLEAAGPALRATIDDRWQRLELANRLEVVSSSVLAVTGELALDTVLRRIVDLARELAGARYAALGVPDATGDLVQFITSGLTEEQEQRIGERPRGRGILGLLLREPKSIRLADLRQHPAAAGFPPGHPTMASFLGVPIVARGRVLGNLYLTEKRVGKEFTEADERLIELIARHAAVAIENARLYRELADQQRRLKAIVDEFPEAILIAEAQPPTITLANRRVSEVLGWEVQTPIGVAEWFARNPRYRPDGSTLTLEELPLYRALCYGEEIVHSEIRLQRADGSSVTVLVNASPLRDPSGKVTAATAAFQDITRIKDAEHLKDDFLSLVSHELRTPLTAIQGGGMLLDREWERLDEEVKRDLVGDIARESRRLGDLIDNMVQLSNIRAGRLTLLTEPVYLPLVIQRAVSETQPTAGARRIHVDLEPDLIVDADPGTLDQVLRNLLDNAVKYTPDGTDIDVSAHSDRECVVISVRDYGPGFDAAEIPMLFERFRRSERARASNVPGMGLGLYLAKHLVEANGGRIWAEAPEGGGALFAFAIPRLGSDE